MLTKKLKQQVLEKLVLILTESLHMAQQAAHAARDLATHEQSKAETQYDTVGLEAAFLAEGQAHRVLQISQEVESWKRLSQLCFYEGDEIKPGVLVELLDDDQQHNYFLLGQLSGGTGLAVGDIKVTVISQHAPMGKQLLGKQVGDDVSFTINNTSRYYEIINAC